MSRAQASGERVEDRTKWDATSRTYANPDGTWATEVWPSAVNFKDEQGKWQRADATLGATERAGYAAETAAGPAKLLVPADSAQSPVRVEDNNGGWLTFKLRGAKGAPEVTKQAATVAEGPGGSVVRYDAKPDGVKESITLSERPSVAPTYTFDLRLAAGLEPVLNDENEIVVTDAAGKARFWMRAPFLQDKAATTTTEVAVALVRAGSGWRLTMTPDRAWLDDAARVYPVVLDPTVTITPPDHQVLDTFLKEEAPTELNGSGTWLRVGSLGTSGTRRRALVKLALPSSIPTGATVDSASLGLRVLSASTTTPVDVAVRQMTTSWTQTGAKWSGSGTGTTWDGATGHFLQATQPNLTVDETIGYKFWDVKAITSRWVATPADNLGFMVKTQTEPAANELRFGSSEALTSQAPKLTIEWSTQPPTITAGSLAITPSLPSGGVVARSLTPTLTATAKDNDSFDIQYRFEVLNEAGQVITPAQSSTSKPNPSPGTAVQFSYVVPAGVLAEGGNYKARFRAWDETTSMSFGPSIELPFQVDQTPTAPSQLAVDPVSATTPILTTPVVDPELSAVVTDPGSSNTVTAKFELREVLAGGGTGPVIDLGADDVDSGSRAAVTVPPEGPESLTPGKTYEFRVGAQDAVDQAQTSQPTQWSPTWTTFKVDAAAQVSVPLQLAEPLTVWHNGPDISWTPYRDPSSAVGDDLAKYQIFRSCRTLPSGACTNPVDTYQQANTPGLEEIAVLEPGETDFRDRAAVPSSPTQAATYRYWVVAQTVDEEQLNKNGVLASNSRDVTTPREGRVRRILNQGADGTISGTRQTAVNTDVLQVGNNHPTDGKQRALLGFDVSVINPGMRITSASMQATQNPSTAAMPGPFALYEIIKHDFVDGQATWRDAATNLPWDVLGGDLGASALGQVTSTSTGLAFTDSNASALRGVVQKWVNDRATNHGVAIRAVDESTAGTRRWLDLVPAQSTQRDPTALTETRPRLVVEHMTTSTLETFSAPDLPQRYIPNTNVTVPVTITNTTETDWSAGLQLSYRWTKVADGSITNGTQKADLFPGANSTRGLKSGESVTVQLIVAPPINSDTGNSRETLYDLQLDLWRTSPLDAWWTSTAGGSYRYYQESDLSAAQRQVRDELLADNVCAMMPDGLTCPRRVIEAPSSSELGLEKFSSYATEATGAGSALLTNLNTGNLAWTYDAMSNPSVGPSFFARVAYNSKDASTNTGMGYGWSVQPGTLSRLNAPMVLSGSDYKAVKLTDGDGTEHGWSNPTTVGTVTTYERPAGIHLDLKKDTSKPDDEFYCFTRPDGTRFYYHRITLLPTKVRDISNNTLTYTYVSGKLTSVADAKGRPVATLGYAGTKISWIRDISGRGLKFEYDADNPDQLVKLRDGGPFNGGTFGTGAEVKEFDFTYATSQANQHSVLTKVMDPLDGSTTIGYYEGTSDKYPSNPGETVPPWVMGNVRSWTDRSGQTAEVEYYRSDKLPSGTTMPAGASRYSRIFDRGLSTPEMTTYGIDAYGRTIELKDANATAPGAPADEADDVTRLAWDADHNVVRQELPNGAVSRWQFDPKTGFPKRTWDPDAVRNGGKPTAMAYHPATADGAVMLKSVTSPLGHASEFEIFPNGQLKSVKDPESGKTSYTYNPADGTMATATDPLGNTTSYTYPTDQSKNVGYPTLITPPVATKAPGDDAPDAPTSFVYDERGNVEKTTTTATIGGATRTLETVADYDAFGRPKFVTSPGAQGSSRTTRYTYDLNDNQLTVEAPNGGLTTTTYFADDQAKTSTLPGNGSGTRMVAFGYDALGRLCREIAPEAGATSASCPASGNAVPPAYATDYRYDHVGQVLSVTGSDHESKAVVTSYNYDNVGNVVGVRDPKMNRAGSTSWTTEAVYDLLGRPTTMIDALGYSSRTVYDADGNVTRTIDQAGKVKKFTYDKAGRNKTVTVSYTAPGGNPEEWTTTNCYDAAGNLVRVIRPRSAVKDCAKNEGLFSQTKYDENNRPFQTLSAFDPSDPDAVYQKPTSTFVKYDALGRMTAQSQPSQADTPPADSAAKQWTRFTHFDSGEIATSVDPTGISTAYEYDLIGKQTKRTLTGVKADGTPSTATRTMTWTYNQDGSLQSRDDATSEATALLADNSDGETTRAGTWTTVKPANGTVQHGVDYLAHTAGGSDHVTWKVTPADTGKYRVEFSCPTPNLDAGEPAGPRTSSASYTLSAGSTTFTRSGDQTGCSGGWRALGEPVDLDAGTPATLKLTPGASGVTVADAVRLVAMDAQRKYSYTYDRNGQQKQVIDDRPGGRVSKFVTGYDVLGRVGSVEEYGAVPLMPPLRQTLYSYDVNSNVTKVEASRLPENAPVDGRGSLGASSTTSYKWDARNLVDTVTQQIGTGTARTWDYQWNSRGLLETLTKPNAAGTAGAGNVVSYKYFDNGLLRDKVERKPGAAGFVTSSHSLTYNPDGDPVRDIGQVQRVNATSSWRKQTVKYAYSPTQALRRVDKTGEKAGDDEAYQYDVAGNVIKSTIGKTTTCNTYDSASDCDASAPGGIRLASSKVTINGVSSTSTYAYDDFGRLSSISNPTVASARASYVYDGFDRVISQTHGELSKTTSYDPFDRVTVQNVTKAGVSKKTRFNYLGTSEQVAAEERWDTGSSSWKQVKAYGYGPDGKPLVMQSTPVTGTAKTRYYSTSTHGDTEALTDPDDGDVTAAYRYTAYGSPDVNDNQGEDTVGQKDDTANPADPTKDALNPYRYSSKRIDSATGDYDMGFRTYSPGLNRFLTRDMYNGALSDLKLGMDPWNTNRYAFAGGNPITRIELDGHRPTMGGEDLSGLTPQQMGAAVQDASAVSSEAALDDAVVTEFTEAHDAYVRRFAGDLSCGEGTVSASCAAAEDYHTWLLDVFALPDYQRTDLQQAAIDEFIGLDRVEEDWVVDTVISTVATLGVSGIYSGLRGATVGLFRSSAANGGANAVRVGQAGEDAVRSAYQIGNKTPFNVLGRDRIADGMTATTVSEVKNVRYQAYTQQLKDYVTFSIDTGRRFDLYVKGGANPTILARPLEEAVGLGQITLRYIP